MADAMKLISTVTVGSGGAASIDFTSIPQTDTDLVVLFSGRTTEASVVAELNFRFNASSSGYSYKYLQGTGSSVITSDGGPAGYLYTQTNGSSATSNTFGNSQIYIPNYTSTVAKSISIDQVSENNATASDLRIYAYSWTGTAAITSVTAYPASGQTFAQYSTASLYTITKGSGGATVS